MISKLTLMTLLLLVLLIGTIKSLRLDLGGKKENPSATTDGVLFKADDPVLHNLDNSEETATFDKPSFKGLNGEVEHEDDLRLNDHGFAPRHEESLYENFESGKTMSLLIIVGVTCFSVVSILTYIFFLRKIFLAEDQ